MSREALLSLLADQTPPGFMSQAYLRAYQAWYDYMIAHPDDEAFRSWAGAMWKFRKPGDETPLTPAPVEKVMALRDAFLPTLQGIVNEAYTEVTKGRK